ncbi:MAG: signal recognition particle receptor subunit alpha [Candidatus Aenigmatarchaeota archaeon]
MVLDNLSEGIQNAVDKISGKSLVDEEVIKEVCKDIQRALLQSDADVELVFDLTESIKKRALNEEPPEGLTEKEHVVNIVYEELVKFVGQDEAKVSLDKGRILLMGTFGSGKTTTSGKLARFYKNRGLKPALVACDTYREAAYDQLKQIGDRLDVPVYGDPDEEDSARVLKDALEEIEEEVVIVDSSGRDALNEDMIEEISTLNDILEPDERFIVIPADMGQQAGKQARRFQEELDITGVVVTKMDGTAKGGGALSACAATGASVKFIGTGEEMKDLEKYDPERFVSQLIGYGDLEGLLERVDEEEAAEQAKKMMEGEFTLEDFQSQMEQVQSMGSLDEVMGKIPGISKSKLPDGLIDMQEEKMELYNYIIDSMTPEEKKDPKVIGSSRKRRIAKGSGTEVENVSELIKLYRQSKKAMKMFKGGRGGMKGNLKKMMKQFGGF